MINLTLDTVSGYPTDTEVRFSFYFVVNYANNYEVKLELYDENDDLVDSLWSDPYELEPNGSVEDTMPKFTGLSPRTSYTVVGSLWNADTGRRLTLDYGEPSIGFVTDAPEWPGDWEWWTENIYSGGQMNATIVNGKVTEIHPLTAREWLAFVYRIVEVYEYMGETVSDTYYNRAVNGVTAGLPMTATQANAARTLIRRLDPIIDETSRVEEGGIITAEFINGLADSLNSVSY